MGAVSRGRTDFIAGLDVVGLLGAGVHGNVADSLERQEEADGEIGKHWRREADGVAEGLGACRNDDGRLAAEGEGVERVGLNG